MMKGLPSLDSQNRRKGKESVAPMPQDLPRKCQPHNRKDTPELCRLGGWFRVYSSFSW